MKKKIAKDFGSYISSRFAETSIPGIAIIFQSKGCFQRTVKLLILVLGLVGFLYQTYEFLQFYWQYSTVVTQSQLKDIKKPAVTICDENLIRRKYFCETKPDACIDAWILEPTNVYYKSGVTKSTICGLFAYYCLDVPWNTNVPMGFAFPGYHLKPGENYLKVPKEYVVEYEDSYFDINFTKAYGFQIEDALVSCEWIDDDVSRNDASGSFPCGKFEFVRVINSERMPAACYTLKSNTARSSFRLENLGRNTRLEMTLRWRGYNLNNLGPNIELATKVPPTLVYYVSFHHPAELTNPFTEGIIIESGKRYKVQVLEVDFTRLPVPYTSACYDYTKDWKKRGGSVPFRKEDCFVQCEIDVNIEKYGCVPRTVIFPHGKKLCLDTPPFDFMINSEIQECRQGCRDACLEIDYKPEAEIIAEIPMAESYEKYDTAFAVTLDINFNVLKSKIIADKPKYESIELFSYIGGYMGMWLGWSLVAVCEFFEILYWMCKYFFVQRSKKRQKPIRRRRHFSTDYYGNY